MAVEAARLVKRFGLLGVRLAMRIMTGNTPHPALACLETPATVHLLNMAGELDLSLLVEPCTADLYSPGLSKILARPKIQEGLPEPWLPPVAGEVALVADTFSLARIEI